jgi:O-antigen/teichoic acid export membrane protein
MFSVSIIAALLAGAASCALIPFGRAHLQRQFTAGVTGWLKPYRSTFRDLARWSLLGVVSTEMTVNAHAYLVTLIAGPQAFALLAVGALFLRPVSLFLTALPEMERPAMARGLVNGDHAAAFHAVKTFRWATASVWIVTLALTAAILFWFPELVLKGRYAVGDVAVVGALWAAIMAVRIFRTPDSVFLQAATEFRPLALASVVSAGASLVLTLATLLIWGPIASLIGILAGEIVLMVRIRILIHRWKRRHD